MTKENLKKANEIMKSIEKYNALIKDFSKKNAVKTIVLNGSYNQLIGYSMTHIDGKLKNAAEMFIEEVVLSIKTNIENLEKKLEEL